jgi:hypothetical protein
MGDSGAIDDERAPVTADSVDSAPAMAPPPRRPRAGRRVELVVGGLVVGLVVAIVVVLIVSGEDGGSVATDAPAQELLASAAENLYQEGSVQFRTEGELDVTPEAGELVIDELAVQATVNGDGEASIGIGSQFAVDFGVTGGPLPPELGPSHLDYVSLGGEIWTRLDEEDWEQSGVPQGVVDLPRFDAPDELLRLALQRGQGLDVAETTTVDGLEAHRISLRLTADDVGVTLADAATAPPARVDVYVGADDARLLRLDIAVDGAAPNPVPAQIALQLRTTYTDHGAPVDIVPPE